MASPPSIVCKNGCAAIMAYLEQLSEPTQKSNLRRLSRQTNFAFGEKRGTDSQILVPDSTNDGIDITRVLLSMTKPEESRNSPSEVQKRAKTKLSNSNKVDVPVLPLTGEIYKLVISSPGFIVAEFGKNIAMDTNISLQYPERYSNFYSTQLAAEEHFDYIGSHPTMGTFILSILKMPTNDVITVFMIQQKKNSVLRVPFELTRTRSRFTKMVKSRVYLSALRDFSKEMSEANITVVNNPEMTQKVVALEKKLLVSGYKFGLINIREGQTREEEYYSNTEQSQDLLDFLELLGERVNLKHFTGYAGGLRKIYDDDEEGWETIVTNYQNYDIVFHCANLLPYSKVNEQQLERKRFIGNDIVVIVFKESSTPFDASIMRSEFNHVFIVVQPIKGANGTMYRIEVITKVGVATSTPDIHNPPLFEKSETFRNFFLSKLINLERAAYEAPNFAGKIERTRKALIEDMVDGLELRRVERAGTIRNLLKNSVNL